MIAIGGRALDGLGDPTDLPNLTKLRIPMSKVWQTDGGC